LLIGRLRGGERDPRAFDGAVGVLVAVGNQQRTAREEPQHAGAVELLEDARNHLAPERAADLLVHLGLAKVLRRLFVRAGDRPGAALPLLVLERPLEALDADRR